MVSGEWWVAGERWRAVRGEWWVVGGARRAVGDGRAVVNDEKWWGARVV